MPTPKPTPPRRRRDARDESFRETLAMPAAPPLTLGTRKLRTGRPTVRLSTTQWRAGLIGLWLVATILAGAGLGRLIAAGQLATQTAVPPTPLATTNLSVAEPTAGSALVVSQPTANATLAVTPATAINQATAGTPVATAATAVYQPAAGPSSLQPGYTPLGRFQGNLGTSPATTNP